MTTREIIAETISCLSIALIAEGLVVLSFFVISYFWILHSAGRI